MNEAQATASSDDKVLSGSYQRWLPSQGYIQRATNNINNQRLGFAHQKRESRQSEWESTKGIYITKMRRMGSGSNPEPGEIGKDGETPQLFCTARCYSSEVEVSFNQPFNQPRGRRRGFTDRRRIGEQLFPERSDRTLPGAIILRFAYVACPAPLRCGERGGNIR